MSLSVSWPTIYGQELKTAPNLPSNLGLPIAHRTGRDRGRPHHHGTRYQQWSAYRDKTAWSPLAGSQSKVRID
jgi:hypothetical protein